MSSHGGAVADGVAVPRVDSSDSHTPFDRAGAGNSSGRSVRVAQPEARTGEPFADGKSGIALGF